ncbi:MAG TPA: hypothetical protein VIL42_10635 [Sphingomicrobium sp.]|jgi:hypothetical protein
MADKQIKVRLLRPLDGREIGETASYPETDARRLRDAGVVEYAAKAQGATPRNKAEGASPSNKARQAPSKKSGGRTRRR